METVKQIKEGEWEVKLGAGILPMVITQADIDFFDRYANSTIDIWGEALDVHIKRANCVAAVKRFLANNAS